MHSTDLSSRSTVSVHDHVRAVALVEVHLFANDGKRDFASQVQAIASEFPTKAFFIDALQQAWSQFAMYLGTEPDDPLGQDRSGFGGAGVHADHYLASSLLAAFGGVCFEPGFCGSLSCKLFNAGLTAFGGVCFGPGFCGSLPCKFFNAWLTVIGGVGFGLALATRRSPSVAQSTPRRSCRGCAQHTGWVEGQVRSPVSGVALLAEGAGERKLRALCARLGVLCVKSRTRTGHRRCG
jgi:hypothetical protein